MKAGFFYAKPQKKVESKPEAAKAPEPVELKAAAGGGGGKKNELEIPQVQEAMKSSLMGKQEEWMTPEFLKKLSTNPVLLKGFSNPESMQAISLFQSNPKKAMEQYGANPEFREFLQEFAKMMGMHFEGMAEGEKKKEEEKKQQQENDPMQEIIDKDPLVKVWKG